MSKFVWCLFLSCVFSMSCSKQVRSNQSISSSSSKSETSPAKALTYTQIHVTAPDTVRLGSRFDVHFRLADRQGKTVPQDDLIQVSANKLGIIFSAYKDVPIKSGIGKIWVESSSWSGQGLLIDAKRRMYDNVFIDGRSDSIVVLPAE